MSSNAHLLPHELPKGLQWLDDPRRLGLTVVGLKRPYVLSFDEGALDRRARQGGELLWRATGASRVAGRGEPYLTLDATAGLCRDAFLMAVAGAHVLALEREEALYLMGVEALARSESPHATRLTLWRAEAVSLLSELSVAAQRGEAPTLIVQGEEREVGVIYLDPMFPTRQKSAAVGRDAQALQALTHSLERSEEERLAEEERLLTLALTVAHYRVVVKRPIKAPPLPGPTPTSAIKGRAIRYDVYGLKALPKG